MCSFYRVGILILVLHDISDVIMEVAKTFVYQKKELMGAAGRNKNRASRNERTNISFSQRCLWRLDALVDGAAPLRVSALSVVLVSVNRKRIKRTRETNAPHCVWSSLHSTLYEANVAVSHMPVYLHLIFQSLLWILQVFRCLFVCFQLLSNIQSLSPLIFHTLHCRCCTCFGSCSFCASFIV